MSVIVVATITPQPDQADEVQAALLEAIPEVHKEPGCEVYSLHVENGGRDFVMIERWESAEALEVHGKAPALTNLAARIGPLLAAPLDVRTFTAVPAGDADKGAI